MRRILDAFQTGLGALLHHPLRTCLSTLGVVIGVASLVAMLSFGDGIMAMAETETLEAGINLPNTVRITLPANEHLNNVPIPLEAPGRLGIGELSAIDSIVAGRGQATLSWRSAVRIPAVDRGNTAGEGDAALVLEGTVPGRPGGQDRPVEEGRGLEPGDADLPITPALANPDALEILGVDPPTAGEGTAVRVGGHDLEIVGLLAPEARSGTFPPPPRLVVPISPAVAGLFSEPTGQVLVEAESIVAGNDLVQALQAWGEEAFPASGLQVTQARDALEDMRQAIRVTQLLVGAIIGISVLVGGIGIMNVMLASVMERTREIGVRRAVGARRRDILLQFLSESVAISAVGSLIGLAAGFLLATIVTAVIRHLTEAPLSPSISVWTLLLVSGVAVGVGVAFGLYPARRAAALTPVEAMRRE